MNYMSSVLVMWTPLRPSSVRFSNMDNFSLNYLRLPIKALSVSVTDFNDTRTTGTGKISCGYWV